MSVAVLSKQGGRRYPQFRASQSGGLLVLFNGGVPVILVPSFPGSSTLSGTGVDQATLTVTGVDQATLSGTGPDQSTLASKGVQQSTLSGKGVQKSTFTKRTQ